LPALPVATLAQAPEDIELHYQYDDLSPVVGAAYKVTFASGGSRTGTLDAQGYALLSAVPKGAYTVEYGEDSRPWKSPPLEPDKADFMKPEVQAAGRAMLEREHPASGGQV
jgi:type VI secretion system secreted protein VgrG